MAKSARGELMSGLFTRKATVMALALTVGLSAPVAAQITLDFEGATGPFVDFVTLHQGFDFTGSSFSNM